MRFLTTKVLCVVLLFLIISDEAAAKKKKSKKAKEEDKKKEEEEDDLPDEEKYLVTKICHMDIELDDEPVGRISIGLFGEALPNTVNNFVALCKGSYRGDESFGLKGTVFHRIVRDFLIQGGDITTRDGSGGKSIYGPTFDDEGFYISHKSPGYISMANYGPDTNSSQFFITMIRARHLDKRHVAFGKVLKGMDVVEKISDVRLDDNFAPTREVIIADTELEKCKSFVLPEDQR